MNWADFHFAEPAWFWALVLIPLVTGLFAVRHKPDQALERLRSFADAHLLPHLVKNAQKVQKAPFLPLTLWSCIWLFAVIAMAGPRWDYTDVTANKPERDLVILLDLSKSMDAEDVKPSRLIRAREEIEDFIDMNRKLSIGLVAFAAVPHMVVPITDDMSTLKTLLPYLDTDLIHIPGARLKPAIEMAAHMLGSDPGHHKSILLVSDGNLADETDAINALPADVKLYTLGIGTSEGAPIPAATGDFVRTSGGDVFVSRLDGEKLETLARAGRGAYVAADYSSHDTGGLLRAMERGADEGTATEKRVRVWNERFWLPAVLMALCLLPFFRKGYVFPVLFLTYFSLCQPANAAWEDVFSNQDQQAEHALEKGDYTNAENLFGSSYGKGVAQYREKKYNEAAQSFDSVSDPKIKLDAEFNAGNAKLLAGKPEDAITEFETYLKERPEDKAAKQNLELAQKALQQKKDNEKKDEEKKQQQKNQQQNNQQQNNKQQNNPSDGTQSQDGKASQSPADSGQDKNKDSQQTDANKAGDKDKEGSGNGSDTGSQAQGNSSSKDKEKGKDDKASASKDSQKEAEGKSAADQGAAQEKSPDRKDNSESSAANGPTANGSTGEGKAGEGKENQQNANPAANDPNNPAPANKDASPSRDMPGDPGKDAEKDPQGADGSVGGNEFPLKQVRRTPEDIDADKWLSRAVSDPAPFLKNKFLMEEKKAAATGEDTP